MNRRLLALAIAAWAAPTLAQPDGGQDVKPPQSAVDFACNQRKPCEVIEVKSAGTGERAEPLSVFKLALGPTKRDDLIRPCEDFEYWLTDGQKTQALLHICNEGYGAAGVGWDEVKVGPNEFTHSRGGGTNWRWSRTTTVRLSPLRILRQEKHGSVVYGTSHDRWEFDYVSFKGSMRWEPWTCESEDTGQAKGKGPIHGYLLIPWLTLPQAYLAQGWKKAPLGSCAAWVDGEQSGFTVHGKADRDNDSSMRVVASGSTLLIEVRDDVWTPASDRWLHDDHLELWSG